MARFLLICTFWLAGISAFAQTSLSGKVTDAKTGEALFTANVVLLQGGKVITGAQTDFDGNYSIAGLDPGTYDIRCSYTAMSENIVTGVPIKNNKSNSLNFAMQSEELGMVIISAYKNKLVDLEGAGGKQLSGKEGRK